MDGNKQLIRFVVILPNHVVDLERFFYFSPFPFVSETKVFTYTQFTLP